MIKEGALDGVRSIFALHIDPMTPTGTIISKPGPMLVGSGHFSVNVLGKGGHAVSPHKTRDPTLTLSITILALQHIVSRETDPLEPRVVSVTYVRGGKTFNVIPEAVEFGGMVRFVDPESYSYLHGRREYTIVIFSAL